MEKNIEFLEQKSYNIGFDIGTNSVGWAVTDAGTGDILEFKHKKMLGSRIFDAGNTAAETRLKRGTRRRYNRRRERIQLLRSLMENMVLEKDENFFRRLDEGFLHKEDKHIKEDHILFNDKAYTDHDYYSDYPTIYHLRSTLCNTKEKMDPRLIYLALHNLVKYRGHFLYQGQKFGDINNNTGILFGELYEQLKNLCDYDFINYDERVIDKIIEILKTSKISKRNKQEMILNQICETMEKKKAEEIVKLMLGYSANFPVIFNDESLMNESGKKIKMSFADADYEKEEEALLCSLDDKAPVLETVKKLYSWILLQEILQGTKTVAEAMVVKYEKHHSDLLNLKAYMHEHVSTAEYTRFFRKEKDGKGNILKNYTNYIKGDKSCSQEDLYHTIQGILNDDKSEMAESFRKEMTAETFLLRLNTKHNAAVPYQLSLAEAEKIIDNQALFYPELRDNKEKILSLITFRIPYYIGPMNNSSRFSWIERKSMDRIYPWDDMEKIVDIDATAEKYIRRMTNKCTYLLQEDVIPKYSLLYSEFVLLNELNKIRINGKLIAPSDKDKMITELFGRKKTVKEDSFVHYLRGINYQNREDYEIEGYQKEKEFSASLISHIDFTKIFGCVNEQNRKMIEKIIYWLTVFEDKEIIKRKVGQEYGSQVSAKQLGEICKLRYKGWSRISEKMLNGLLTGEEGTERKTVIEIMHETNQNFMQVINDKKYGFDKLIKDENQLLHKENITVDDVMELQGSPAIKRSIWQTVRIINEVVEILGKNPENIFVEFAREENEKKRSVSREKMLTGCYAKLKEITEEYNREVEAELKKPEYVKKLDSERMLLYFIQNGKCMYTPEALDIDHLELYQVDHILPQAYIKDDSIENKVLVTIDANQAKTDKLLLDEKIRSKQYYYWTNLYKCGLIGAKKYRNLLRETVGETEIKGFINRQIVETRQITKHIAGLLSSVYANTNVVAVRADLSHNFREKYAIYKSREINNFHHAHDAYIAVTLGSFLMKMFPNLENELIYNKFIEYRKNCKKESFMKSKYGYILHLLDQDCVSGDGEIIWKPNYIDGIRSVIDGKDCLVTHKLEEETGAFYKESIYKHDSKEASIPLKNNLPVKKYGGYSKRTIAYSCVVSYKKGKKQVKKLIGIPCYIVALERTRPGSIDDYLKKELKTEEFSILKNGIKKYQKVIENGNELYLTSDQEVINAKEFYYNPKGRELDRKLFMKCITGHCTKEEQETDEVSQALTNTFEYMRIKSKGQYSMYADAFEKAATAIKFQELSYDDKLTCLRELLKLTSASAACANLAKFSSDNVKLSERIGRKCGYNLDLNHTVFVDQSTTGLYERRYQV